MDPVRKLWMFENWLGDQKDQGELAKNHAYLLGSFTNPEAVKQLMGEGNVHESTEEELEESSNFVREYNLKALEQEQGGRRRRRRLIVQG
jgi:hypothetical protein